MQPAALNNDENDDPDFDAEEITDQHKKKVDYGDDDDLENNLREIEDSGKQTKMAAAGDQTKVDD